jgi:hypothetical protein
MSKRTLAASLCLVAAFFLGSAVRTVRAQTECATKPCTCNNAPPDGVPIGPLNGRPDCQRCKCTSNGLPALNCRVETCKPCSGSPSNSYNQSCLQNQAACNWPDPIFCMGLCQ